MYLRPKLSRKKSSDMIFLAKEQKLEKEEINKKINEGEEYSLFRNKVLTMLSEIQTCSSLSDSEKAPIIKEINFLLNKLENQYFVNIDSDVSDMIFSSEERLEEMKNAIHKRQNLLDQIDHIQLHTNVSNKEKICQLIQEQINSYYNLLITAKSDLQFQHKQLEEQRRKIHKSFLQER